MIFLGVTMGADNVDLNLLRVFEVVMKERSVTKAAVRLGRTQSAISHSINKLRYLFKDQLFTRDGGTIRPTPRALELLVDLSGALATIETAIDRYQAFHPAETRANFRVGLTDYHSFLILPNLIRRFAHGAPKATLNIIPVSTAEVSAMVHSRQLDCALIGSFESDDPGLHRVELGEDRFFCAVWSGSQLAKGKLTLERYLAADHIQVSSDGLSEGLADAALRQQGLRRRVVATISNYPVIPWVLRGTELLTHCGDNVSQIINERSEVAFLTPPIPIPNVRASLITHRQLLAHPPTIWLTSMVETVFKDCEAEKRRFLSTSRFVRLN